MNRRLTTAIGLLALGVLLLYLTTSQIWFTGTTSGAGFTSVSTYRGSSQQGLGALALGSLAAGAALIATRGRARLLVAFLTAALGVGIVAVTLNALADRRSLLTDGRPLAHAAGGVSVSTSAWPCLAVAAGVVIVLGGVLGGLAAGGGSLSAKYEAPAAAPATPATPARDFADVAAWQALDRDEDPTGT